MAEDHGLQSSAILLEKLQGILEQELPAYELISSLPQAWEELNTLRQAFIDIVSAEAQEIQEYCQEPISTVHKYFDEYYQLLGDIEMCGTAPETGQLQDILRRVEEISNNLSLAFIGYRQASLLARGPTPHSGLNLIVSNLQRLQGGEECRDDLEKSVGRESALVEQALILLRSSEDDFRNKNLISFYTSYQELLSALSEVTGSLQGDDIQVYLNGLYDLGLYFERVDMKHQIEAYWYSPTSLPLANLVLNTGQNFVEGKGEADIFRFFLEEFKKVYNVTKAGHDESAAKAATGMEKEQRDEAGAALEEIARALLGFEQVIFTADRDLYTQCANYLQWAAGRYAAAASALAQMAEMKEKVYCLHCGTENLVGEVSCNHCRALLPQVENNRKAMVDIRAGFQQPGAAQDEPEEKEVPLHVHQLFESAQGLESGAVSKSDFDTLLAEMEERLKEAYKAAKDVPKLTPEIIEQLGKEQAEKSHALLSEAGALYNKGLEEFFSGLMLFREYSTSLMPGTMEKAKDILWQGAEKLQKARKLVQEEYGKR